MATTWKTTASAIKASAGKRILMLLENNSYSCDVRVRLEAETLTAAGYFVTVISPADSGQKWNEVHCGVRVYSYPAPPENSSFLGYLWEYSYSLVATFLLSLVAWARGGFDVVHAHNPPDLYVFIGAFYRLFGKRFVFDHHDLSPEMYRALGKRNALVYRLLVWMEKLTCKMADRVIATNVSYKQMEMERGGVPEHRITIVRNGPDLARWQLVEPDPALRSKAKHILGYVGVMGYQDGVDHLLRALSHLRHDLGRSDFYCVIVGRGNALSDLKQLATRLGLDDVVWFTGFVPFDDLLRYLSTADICVDPDPSNPFNDRSTMTKVLAYMALGKPMVVFDLPEHRFSAQGGALYASPNDDLEFARSIAHLMDNPEQRRTMGCDGRQRVSSELSWKHSIPHLLKAYEQLWIQMPMALLLNFHGS